MAPVSLLTSGNTCGCRMSYTTGLSWCHVSIQGVTVYCRQFHPIPLHQLWEWCVALNKGRIEACPTGSPHTNTIVISAEIESGFVAKDDLVPVSSYVEALQTESSMCGRQG
ncbi:hypothetical protein TNCV_3858011 [Trichonephila clavipes]|nr:hypothetical protein TNCV_3858011 [Trichonephila clavipes]